MAKKTLKDLSKKMKNLDFCMMTTVTDRGLASSRPMSNNGDVEYDGNSYFFTSEKSKLVKDLVKNAHVNLAFNGPKSFFASVTGEAQLVRNRAQMKPHWCKDLKKWFKDGLDSPDLVMIRVKAEKIKYWTRHKEGEIVLKGSH